MLSGGAQERSNFHFECMSMCSIEMQYLYCLMYNVPKFSNYCVVKDYNNYKSFVARSLMFVNIIRVRVMSV